MLWYLAFSFNMDVWNNSLFYKANFSEYPNLYKDFCCQCSSNKILLYLMKLGDQNWEHFSGAEGQSIHITALKYFISLSVYEGLQKTPSVNSAEWLQSMWNTIKDFNINLCL